MAGWPDEAGAVGDGPVRAAWLAGAEAEAERRVAAAVVIAAVADGAVRDAAGDDATADLVGCAARFYSAFDCSIAPNIQER